MEEGALASLEGWGGFQWKQFLPDPNVQMRNSGLHSLFQSLPLSRQGLPHRWPQDQSPDAAVPSPDSPVPSRGQAWLLGLRIPRQRSLSLLFPWVPLGYFSLL